VPPKRLFLIDAFGFIFRAYHARARSGAPPMRTNAGLSTEAVYIFNNMVRKLAKQYAPPYIAAVFESGEPSHRLEEFPSTRPTAPKRPPTSSSRSPTCGGLWTRCAFPCSNTPASKPTTSSAPSPAAPRPRAFEVVVVSSDKDMLQLVDERVSMLNPAKDDEWYDPAKVKVFMGVRPDQVTDLLALKGDAVDNIPGAPGIGDKGAKDLIERFGNVEEAIAHAAEVERKAYAKAFRTTPSRSA